MKIDEVAPIILDYCIQFLHTKEVGSKYRPKKNTFILNTRLITRIMKHNGNLNAETSKSDNMFFANIIGSLIKKKEVSLPLGRGTYDIRTRNGLEHTIGEIVVEKHKWMNIGGLKNDVGTIAYESKDIEKSFAKELSADDS